jgi:hypothetical protein
MLGIKIKIRELENGFVVELFSQKGSSEFDKEIYCTNLEDVLSKINEWAVQVAKIGKEA